MSFNTTAGEFMKAIVHDNHPYRIPGCLRVGKTVTIGDLVFKLINNSLNDVVSPWQLRISKVCPDEVHF